MGHPPEPVLPQELGTEAEAISFADQVPVAGQDAQQVGVFPVALVLVWNLIASFFGGKTAGDNPWNAWTLEWDTTSPPPHENFYALPPIRSRRPLWDIAHPEDPDWKHEHEL